MGKECGLARSDACNEAVETAGSSSAQLRSIDRAGSNSDTSKSEESDVRRTRDSRRKSCRSRVCLFAGPDRISAKQEAPVPQPARGSLSRSHASSRTASQPVSELSL